MRRVLITGLMGFLATGALAHSPLQSTNPPNAAVLASAPEKVSLTFGKDIRLTRVTVTHSDGRATDFDLGEQTRFTTDFILPLTSMGAGEYVIEWRGLSDDGHALKGAFSFTVD